MGTTARHFKECFHEACKHEPYGYQCRLACGDDAKPDQPSTLKQGRACESLLIDIPTGLGKTAAVVMAWLWNRMAHPAVQHRNTWPRRLVYCLPMRTLVEQTHEDTRGWLKELGLTEQVGVHLLMGGEDDGDWDIHPERNAILIGTQDMLLSRALNRGYGMSRFRWPMHFAFLNNDALWVMDETQLMGVGVETSAQLDGFRSACPTPVVTCATWWMSATLADAQLDTVDHRKPEGGWETITLSENEKRTPEIRQRIEARKPVEQAELSLSTTIKSKYEKNLAAFIAKKHQPDTLTLVIVNRVNRAQAVYEEVCKLNGIVTDQVALIHSRFRPKDRKQHEKLISKEAKGNRIVIATQAVEAGVDISARLLITELAPWSSLVQRFGRCNRKGEWNETKIKAEIVWIDLQFKDEKDVLPYNLPSLNTARENLEKVSDVSPLKIAAIKVEPKPVLRPVLRRKDLLDLFDTTADLCGQDIDISRYIRDGDDTDVQVFWRDFSDEELKDQKPPQRDELCRVGVHTFREFCKKNKPWVWNHLEDQWERAQHIVPGVVYLLKVENGGYSDQEGWTGETKDKPTPYPPTAGQNESYGGDPLTFQGRWQTIAEHTADVRRELDHLLATISLDPNIVVAERGAALWHDLGKAHPVFQAVFRQLDQPRPDIWAKSANQGGYPKRDNEVVSGFRHELASALAWLAAGPADHPERDLVAYLIAAHHGKVRLSIRSLPEEKPTPPDPEHLYARGIWDRDQLPAVPLGELTVAPLTLDLSIMQMGDGPSGPSWLSRMIALRDRLGPFRLVYYEALLRVADQNASAKAAAIKNEVHPNQPIS
jgi:CRISPR-associated endonuclease/helicase Cas3